MELCQGDITEKNWVLWNVTLAEAMEWVGFILKRRFEWIEIVGQMFSGVTEDEGKDKKCRDTTLCSMCRKTCSQRL